MKNPNNYAFIDGQNLNLSIRELGWKLDYKKFRVYLKEKYQIEKAYYFIGYIEGNSNLYRSLQESGYILIFKETVPDVSGKIKGNVDSELVLNAMIEYSNYNQAVIIAGDGDYACLAKYLIENKKLKTILVPNYFKYSCLLRKCAKGQYIAFMNNLKGKLAYKKKRTP